MVDKKQVFTLHRYFIYADRMKVHFYDVLATNRKLGKPASDIDTRLYMSLWYGLLYVVIEGWESLGIKDKKIDSLLNSKNKEHLKRYRNGTFHFQTNYEDDRFYEFITSEERPVQWIRKLNEEFSRFFLNWLNKNKPPKLSE